MAQRGRPRTDSIPRFNVDTNLMNNPKFIRFRRVSGLTDLGAWTLLIKFFNYVNANHALTGYVPREEADDLEDFCCLATIRAVLSSPNSPESSTKTPLYDLLTQSGFLEPDGAVHDHDGNQPLVAEIRRKREQREKKQEEKDFGRNCPDLSSPNSPNVESLNVENPNKKASKASLLPPNSLQNVDKSKTLTNGQRSNGSGNDGPIQSSGNGRISAEKPAFWPQVNEFLEELQEPHVHGTLSENDLAGLRNDLKKYGLPCKAVQDWLIMRISKDRSEKRAGENGLDSQVGWLRAQIRSPDLN